jgi:hypothetical protein
MDSDWALIVASFAEQFGIRLEIEDISWIEYTRLFQGISGDSALGRIVSIRSEKDPKVIKHFSPEQKRIRREWITRQQNENPDTTARYLKNLENQFRAMFGSGKR